MEKIIFQVLVQSDYTFPNHICWTYQNSIAAIKRFNDYSGKAIGLLPRLFVCDPSALPTENCDKSIHVNVRKKNILRCAQWTNP